MSHFDYEESIRIAAQDHSFKALIMAAMRKADTNNMAKLTRAFPDIRDELLDRYNAPGGLLPGERNAKDSTGGPEEAGPEVERPASLG